MRVAVQLVNYRTRKYLERCLATVVPDLEASGLEFELNLLDNDSGEPLDDLAVRLPSCQALRAERNLGFGGGHNLLASRTRADCLLILNPDVEFVQRDTVVRLVAALSGVQAVGPQLVDAAGAPQRWDHGELSGVRAWISRHGGAAYWRPRFRRVDAAWVSGAALLIERAAFAQLGGFDERFFLYKEEEDLCLRLRAAGGRVRYMPDVVVRHEGSVVAARGVELARSTELFIAKHHARSRTRPAFAAVHRVLPYLLRDG